MILAITRYLSIKHCYASVVYIGYTSGHYSHVYVLCKDDVLWDVRTGVYQSVGEITSALKTCDGA